MRQVWTLTSVLLKQLYHSRRCYLAVGLLWVQLFICFQPIARFARDYQLSVNIAVVGLLFTDVQTIIVWVGALLLLFAQVPSSLGNELQLLARLSAKKWLTAQFVYGGLVLVGSILFCYVSAVLVFQSGLVLDNQWGKVIGSMNYYPDLVRQYDMRLTISNQILTSYTPYMLQVIFVGLTFLVGFFCFTCLLVLNLIKKGLGYLCVSVQLFIGFAVHFFPGFVVYWIAPIAWLSIDKVSTSPLDALPSWQYVISFLLVGIAAMMGVSYFLVQHRRFMESRYLNWKR